MTADEGLVKVVVEYLDDGVEKTERMWAKPFGEDLFELRNTPWYVYKLSFLDVVRCAEFAPDEAPRVVELVQPGGHRTLRILFNDRDFDAEHQEDVLARLNDLRAFYERHSARFVSVDVEPEADYQVVYDYLAAESASGALIFEEAWKDDGREGFGPTYDDVQPRPDWA